MEIAIIDPKEFGIEETQASEITQGLIVPIGERELLIKEFDIVSKLEVTTENLPKFKELRLKIVKNRTQGFEAWHSVNKEYFLRGGQFVDATKRREVQVNMSMESVLMDAEKFFENQEKQRIADLQVSRIAMLSEFVESTDGLNLGSMSQDIFDGFLLGAKTRHENKLAEAKKIEEDRIAKEKADEAIRIAKEKADKAESDRKDKELAKLKAEADKKEKEMAEQKAKSEALAKLEADKQKKIQDELNAKLKAEQDAKAKIEAELKAKREVETKAKADAEAKIEADKKEYEKNAKAPIKAQMNRWVDIFELPATHLDNETAKEIKIRFEGFKNWAKKQIETI